MQRKKQQKRIYAFVDSQNLNVSTQKFGWKMDWRKFRKFLRDRYGVTHAYLFIGYVPEFRNMYEFLHDAGYGIVLKPTLDMLRHPGEDGKTKPKDDKQVTKGNVDADLVLRVMIEFPNYDKAVIVSGDGDFFTLIEYLIKQDKLAKVLTPNIHYSTLFKPFEEYIEQLGKYRGQLAYHDRKKKKPTSTSKDKVDK